MNSITEQTEILRVQYRNAYESARKNSLYAILLTFATLVLIATVGFKFYFSAYVPVSLMETGVYAKDLAKEYTDAELIEEGLADEVFAAYREQLASEGDSTEYTDEQLYEMGVADEVIAEFRANQATYQTENYGMVTFIIMAGLALIIAAFYLVCWLLSKKHPAWLIVLTVTYALDTLIMIPDLFSYYLVYDIRGLVFLTLYHVWILWILINGVKAGVQLKKLPAPIEGEAVEVDATVDSTVDSTVDATVEAVPAEVAAPADIDNTPEA